MAASIGFKKPWNQGIEYYIDEFFIHPDYQGLKVGSRLMQYIEKKCQNEQLNAIILNTERGYPSELFYKNNQFTEHEGLIIMSKSIE
ncbi:GNAT family N-acetyltransferase [Acinetobacter rudis]|uniref:GNAT family N-acetyltransferase n=1 Tax=Acinetobacter rudis TaxID=632955 RepID=UPI0035BE35DB